MKILGVITEYNPFHNGHIYHIEKAKEITNSDMVIAIMSGNFTQQGNISIYDKFKRAKLATNHGIDIVIELPTIYANSSSNFFSKGAISLLDSLNIVNCLCFGSEAGNIEVLNSIASKIKNNEDEIWKDISVNLKKGISFAKARQNSISKYLSPNEINEFSKPNNILGIDYLYELLNLQSNITPYTILRNSSNFDEDIIKKDSSITSAKSIRQYIYDKNNILGLKNVVPKDCFDMIKDTSPTFNDKLFEIIKYNVITLGKEGLSKINDITEGLENKIYYEISNSISYNNLLENIKSKRYQMSKIKRMLNNIVLKITKSDFDEITSSGKLYAHILSISENGKALLSQISKNSNINLITSLNENTLTNLPPIQRKMINIDIYSSNIYSILNNERINMDYTNRL